VLAEAITDTDWGTLEAGREAIDFMCTLLTLVQADGQEARRAAGGTSRRGRGRRRLPTDFIAHAGFDMELATCPAGDSNRAQSLIAKRFQRRRSSCRLSTTRSIIGELAEREDASRATRMTRTRPPRHVDDED
jgi:hypothetical protein